MSNIIRVCTVLIVILGLSRPSFAQEETVEASLSRWSLGVGGGWFGIPRRIMDMLVCKSPSVGGMSCRLRLGYERGSKGFTSTVYIFSLVYEGMSGSGIWQHKKGTDPIKGNINFSQYSASVSILFHLFDFFPLNPYFGIGLGAGRVDAHVSGQLVSDIEIEEEDEIDLLVPVLCLPLGLRLKVRDTFNIQVEGGFQNGFYFCGIFSLYF